MSCPPTTRLATAPCSWCSRYPTDRRATTDVEPSTNQMQVRGRAATGLRPLPFHVCRNTHTLLRVNSEVDRSADCLRAPSLGIFIRLFLPGRSRHGRETLHCKAKSSGL